MTLRLLLIMLQVAVSLRTCYLQNAALEMSLIVSLVFSLRAIPANRSPCRVAWCCSEIRIGYSMNATIHYDVLSMTVYVAEYTTIAI